MAGRPLSAYLAVCAGLTAPAFVERFPGPFLVHSSRTGGTLQRATGGRTMDSLVVDDSDEGAAEVLTVFTVAQFAARTAALAVGSDRNCALQVDAVSVSRLHALLRGGGDRWRVEDAGSSAGTWVDGVALQPKVPCDVVAGSRLSLGALDLTFMPAEHFHAFVLRTRRGESG